jgi:hypothetical protein
MLLRPKILNRQRTNITASYVNILRELQLNIIPLLYVVSNQYAISDIYIDVCKNLVYITQQMRQMVTLVESFTATTISYHDFSSLLSAFEELLLRYKMIACFKYNNEYVFDSNSNTANKIASIEEIYETFLDALHAVIKKAIIVDIPINTSPSDLVHLMSRCVVKNMGN